jgi:DNA-binding NtrC family response regulator
MGLKNRSAMMNEFETLSRTPVAQLQGAPAAKTNVGTESGKCLIVSTDVAKREMISVAATEAGWDTIVCTDERTAAAAVLRTRFQMAWIDLDGSLASSVARDLCQSLATLSQVLLVVCGRENDAEEEVWARQLGVWLYLPGLSPDHPCEICLLCEQAQRVAGRSNVPS